VIIFGRDGCLIKPNTGIILASSAQKMLDFFSAGVICVISSIDLLFKRKMKNIFIIKF